MYLARVETKNFSFMAFADTKEGATEQLKVAWLLHRQNTLAELTWDELEQDVQTDFFRQGDTFLDGELWLSYGTPDAYPLLSECTDCWEVFEGKGDTCPNCERCSCGQSNLTCKCLNN